MNRVRRWVQRPLEHVGVRQKAGHAADSNEASDKIYPLW
jgi:hypothetical protein